MESVCTDRTLTWKKKIKVWNSIAHFKGKKVLAEEWFVVAIAFNKGVIKCYQYFGPINSETCKSFIDELFSDMLKYFWHA